MPEDLKIRISFDIEGDLARAFVKEQGRVLSKTGSMSDAAKSTLGRAALAAFLRSAGYEIGDTPDSGWGGDRTSKDAEAGQLVGVGAN